MSYKRVITKKGKTYGPYKYESYRDEHGNVKKRYLGKIEEKKKNIFVIKLEKVASKFKEIKTPIIPEYVWFVGIALILLISIGFLISITGFSVLNLTLENNSIINKSAMNVVGNLTGAMIENKIINPETSNIFKSAVIPKENITTLQYEAVINRPVKWIKKINITKSNASVELPKGSINISILVNNEIDVAMKEAGDFKTVVENTDRKKIAKGVALTGNVALDVNKGNGIFTRIWLWLISFRITGNVISEEGISKDIIQTKNATIVEVANIATNEDRVAVEYYTEAPKANETELTNGKRIIVSAPSELNYTDILAYSVVEGMGIRMNDPQLKLYWYEDIEEDVSPVIIEPVEEFIKEPIQELEEELEIIKDEEIVDEPINEVIDNETSFEIPVKEKIENVTGNIQNKTEDVENGSQIDETPLQNNNLSDIVEDDMVNSTDDEQLLLDEETFEEPIENQIIEQTEEIPIEEIPIEEIESSIDDNLDNFEESTGEESDFEESNEPVSLITGAVIATPIKEMESEITKYLNPNIEVNRTRKSVPFIPYDFDNDGYVDYIEWVVPHLSVQVYEIIYITEAQHLDANYNLIKDVYDEVKAQDGVYTGAIHDGEYIRVWFEKELDSSKDITIYAKSNGSSSVEVYVKDGIVKIAEFDFVDEPKLQKIYLINLIGRSDSFDLKVRGDAVQFDYIVDPTPITLSIPQTFNIHGRLSNSTDIINGTFVFNFSIYNSYVGGTSLWNSVRNVTTDNNGVYDVILNVSGLSFDEQYYLGIAVEGDNEMTPRFNLTSNPYAFMAQNVYVGGIIWDDNMDASGYNITADYFIGDGSLLTGINGGSGASGGWTNDSNTTTTDLNAWVGGNLTVIGNLNLSGTVTGQEVSRVRVTKNTAQIIPNALATVIEYNSEDYDILGEYDNTTNYRFTATEAGYYSISASILSDTVAWVPGKWWMLEIWKNGALFSRGDRNQADSNITIYRPSSVYDVLYLGTNDYVEIRAVHNQGGNVSIYPSVAHNYFSVIRLSSPITIGGSSGASGIWTNVSGTATYDGDVVIKI